MCGLEYLHSKQIIHQNIRPDNILVAPTSNSAQFKLSDIGSRKESLSVWMAPETLEMVFDDIDLQSLPTSASSAASDVWSLGCVFFYFLQKGQHPFAGDNMVRTLNNIIDGDPTQLSGTSLHLLAVYC